MNAENQNLDTARIHTRIAEVGAVLEEQLGELTGQMHALLAGVIDQLQGDPRLLELLYASIKSNLETLVHIMRHDIPVDDVSAPAAALEYARRLAQKGITSTALIRAYRLGQQTLVDWAFAQFRDVEEDPDVVLEAGRQFAGITFRYVDSISEQVVSEYESERERWLSNRNTLRAAMVGSLLEGGHVNVASAEQATGYRLRQHHLGVVLWGAEVPPSDVDLALIEEALTVLAQAVGVTSRPLFLARERSLGWGWLPLGRRGGPVDLAVADARIAALSPGLRVAIGAVGADIEGFRSSHIEAQRARNVALVGGEASRAVTSYADPEVRTAALLATDTESTKQLVGRALGDLASDTEGAARLRETLGVFLHERGSYASTAERVHLHKNTVKYRVDRAVEERGRPLDDERLELELALVACRMLGPSVLRPE